MTRGVLLDTHSLLWLRAGDRLPGICGYGDPGDCFLIATAHVENLTLVTRDARIIELANRRPDYLTVIPC